MRFLKKEMWCELTVVLKRNMVSFLEEFEACMINMFFGLFYAFCFILGC